MCTLRWQRRSSDIGLRSAAAIGLRTARFATGIATAVLLATAHAQAGDNDWPAATQCTAEGRKIPRRGPDKEAPLSAVVVARYRSIEYRETIGAALVARCPIEGAGGPDLVSNNWGYLRARLELIEQLSGKPLARRTRAYDRTGEWGPRSEAHKAGTRTAYLICLKEHDGFMWRYRDAPLERSRDGALFVPVAGMQQLGLDAAMAHEVPVLVGGVVSSVSGVLLTRLDPARLCR